MSAPPPPSPTSARATKGPQLSDPHLESTLSPGPRAWVRSGTRSAALDVWRLLFLGLRRDSIHIFLLRSAERCCDRALEAGRDREHLEPI